MTTRDGNGTLVQIRSDDLLLFVHLDPVQRDSIGSTPVGSSRLSVNSETAYLIDSVLVVLTDRLVVNWSL